MTQKTSVFAVLDLALARIVNGADCRPALSRSGGRGGGIAQLGERVVRNDEVGGSIPPGSTTLRPSGFAWRSHVMAKGRSVVPGVALLGEDGLQSAPNPCTFVVRPSGFAWRSHVMAAGQSVVPGVAHLGEDGLQPLTNLLPRKPRRPFFHKTATPSRK